MSGFLDEIEQSVPGLRRYARALTRNADRADDLVQDCIERALRKRGLFREEYEGATLRENLGLHRPPNGLALRVKESEESRAAG